MSDIQPVRILIADSDENAAEALVSAFRNAAIPVRAQFVSSESSLNCELQRQVWDLMLVRQGADIGGLAEVITFVRQYDAALPVLSLEIDSDPARLTDAMREGAADAILPGQDDRLLMIVRRELIHARQRARLRRAESAVSEVEHRADLLLNVVDAGVAYVLDGMHVAANRVYLEMFGYSDLDDLLGATMLDLVGPEDKETFKQSLRAVSEGTSNEFELRAQHRNGAQFPATMTVLSAAYEGEPCWQVVLRRQVVPVDGPGHDIQNGAPEAQRNSPPAVTCDATIPALMVRDRDRDHMLRVLQSFHADSNAAEAASSSIVGLLITNYTEVRALAGLEPTWRLTSKIAELLDEALHAPHRILRVAEDAFVLMLQGMDALSAAEEIEQLTREISAQCARDSAGTLMVHIATTTMPLQAEFPTSLSALTPLLVQRDVTTSAGAPTADATNHRHDAQHTKTNGPAAKDHQHHDQQQEQHDDQQNGYHKQNGADTHEHAFPAPVPAALEPVNEQIIPRLHECLAENAFVLFFQPIISVRGDSDEHYEAFLRMPLRKGGEQNDDTAMLSAEEFLGAALQAGLGGKIDRWVILQAIKLLSAHRASGHETRLTVNLCAMSMLDPGFVPWLGVAIRAARLPSDALIFQITESDAMANLAQAKAFTRGMHDLHCRTSLSRFTGAGNASQLLRHLPVDFVKLDPSLIDAVQSHPEYKDELSKLIALLQGQGRLTIVPMVENAKLLAALWQAGANYIQGHYLQEPTTEMDFDFTSEE